MTDDRTPAHRLETDRLDEDGEAADYVAPVDHGHGREEELTDGSDKGSFTTSTDFGDGEHDAPNALREPGDYVSDSDDALRPDGEYVDDEERPKRVRD